MIWIIHYLRKSIIFFSVPAALLSACSGADDILLDNPNLNGVSWNKVEVRSDTFNIKSLKYTSPTLETADVINDHYPWFNNLTQWYKELWYDSSVWNNKKNFVYPHVLISYITWERYRWDNMEYIIVWEIPANYECEDVWPNWTTWDDHANQWYNHIRIITPFSTIKACWWGWDYVIKYVDSHPEKNFMLSCASDDLGWDTPEELRNCNNYPHLKKLLEMENVIISVAWFDKTKNVDKTLNENEKEQKMGMYKSASVNSGKNNKITVMWYNPAKNNIFRDDSDSAMPIGFDNVKWNIVMAFTDLVTHDDCSNLTWSATSKPTPALSSTLWNHLSVIMRNHPWTTLEDASTIMQDEYLRVEKFKYKDTDGVIKEGGDWYFFDSDKFLKSEILHEAEIKQILTDAAKTISEGTSSSVSLPAYPGLIYSGPGIFFAVDGTTYEMTSGNQTVLETAIKSGSDIQWSYNPNRVTEYGISETNTIIVQFVDTKAQVVPDVSVSITYSLKGTSTGIRPVYMD